VRKLFCSPSLCFIVNLVLASTGVLAGPVLHPAWTANHWDVEDGLPVNSINAMVRDADGFLWLATMDGLVRFDGVSFKIFNTLNSPGLAGNRLLVLARDREDALWMTTEDMRLVRRHGGRFRTLNRADGLPHDSVTALSVSDAALWVGTRRGAARWNGIRFEALADAQWSEATGAVLDPGDGTIWFGSESGRLLRLDTDGSSRTAMVAARVWQMVSDGEGGAWIAHDAGLAHWNGGEPVTEVSLGFGVQRLARAGQALYLASGERMFHLQEGRLTEAAALHRGSGRERLIRVDDGGTWINQHAGLMYNGERVLAPSHPVSDWFPDGGGGLLVATAGDGLYRLGASAFDRPAGPPELLQASTYPITVAADGAIWIGTNGQGLYRIRPDETLARRIAAESAPAAVHSVLPDHGESGWIGGAGLWRLEAGVAHQRGIPDELKKATVRTLMRDRRGRIWAGTGLRGIWRLQTGIWRRIPMPTTSADSRVRVISEHGEYLWFGTNGHGLLRFREAAGFEPLIADAPGRLIRALHFDQRGRLLMGTEDRGLCRLDRPDDPLEQARIRCLDLRNGLPHHGIHQILSDASGNLWMSTNRGIFSVSEQSLDAAFDGGVLTTRTLTEADGMPDREANGGVQSAGAVDAIGRLWFPTMQGPVALDTRRLPEPAPPPAVVIEQLATAAGSLPLDGNAVDLPQGVRSFSLRFTAPDFASGPALRFETRLIGLDDHWQSIGERRDVDFTHLPHGAHRFEVRARTADGRVGRVAGLDLVVPPLFHEVPAIRIAAALLLLALAWWGWRWRERQMLLDRMRLEHEVDARTHELSVAAAEAERARDHIAVQAERLERLDQEKRAFFANISHELRTPLTLLLGPLEQGQRDPESVAGEWPLMYRNARRLNRLVEQILDLQRIEGGQLQVEPELHDLVAWTGSITELFRPLSETRGMSITISAPAAGVLAWFDPTQLEKVLGNLLSNAIKYCRPGDQVEVSVARAGETALVQVCDSGPGIAEEHLPRLFDRFYRAVPSGFPIEGTGIGLALARELMILHGGDLGVDSAPDAGARFSLRWPARAMDGRLLPNALEASAASSPPCPARAAPHDTQTASDDAARILVVDDNADLRLWLRHVLGARYQVDEAGDGKAALEAMASHLPDLVVSDWMMPGMDGIELLERMREVVDYDGVPVIVLSARAELGDRVMGLDAGAVVYLQKPFSADLLRAQIESLLALRLRLRRALAETPAPVPHRASESAWLRHLRDIIGANLHDPAFGVEELAERSAIGRTGLFRRLKEEIDASPSALLREARLQRAAELLDQRAGSVSEVAYAVGFNSVDGFTRAFTARFRQRPSERLVEVRQRRA
jgi:signal transduction histidine kinase/ligand-binding sensor domain-containing protein/DNA-binding NarL/FixJ family response regulator